MEHKEGRALKNLCFLTVLEKTLESPLDDQRRSNQSILKEINPEYSLEGLMLKLKLQSFGHQMWRADSLKTPWCWERLKAEGDNRGRDGWTASLTQWTWVWASTGRWWRTRKPGALQSIGSQRVGHSWVTELNWTELSFHIFTFHISSKEALGSTSCC